ncbi:glycosyltransferase family 4 protein [Acidithiobacillus thiooxidans]|uniref:Group 1 glycosyl transferase n=1 Tax=Acidithiobacillus thiooxidans ATCC 19377 TaxID=637390 RepID=A0A5P9XNM6_ACITH|nr:glycosyltransferase family 1 protein [Acidithiobacillus thiooxidans]QFX95299.1 group 1 glycosyl transferase [Acidithiobacillus thiooxidans ATCC 19377]
MKVLFNLQTLLYPRTGIGHYTQHLIEEMGNSDEIEELSGFLSREIYSGTTLSNFVKTKQIPTTIRTKKPPLDAVKKLIRQGVPDAYVAVNAWNRWIESRSIRKLASTGYVYHEPNFIPVPYSGPLVINVHDLSHIRHPQFHPPERVKLLNIKLSKVIMRADHIVTDSHFVAEEITELYSVPLNKITVTYLGTDVGFHERTANDVADTLKQFRLHYRGFVLSVATLEPRKNIERLVTAYSTLPESVLKEYPLVLVGGSGWRDSKLLACLKSLEVKANIIRTGYLPRTQLQDLYASAAVFAYPSLYEGFGLPVLEAFASGTPVLTSNNTSLHEVSGGAALEIDPTFTDAIRDGLNNLLNNPSLAQKYAQSGLKRSMDFSWQKCAEQTLAVYRRLS